MKLYVGIDASSKDMKACLMNQDGATLQKHAVDNNFHGASYLQIKLPLLMTKALFKRFKSVWKPLMLQLASGHVLS